MARIAATPSSGVLAGAARLAVAFAPWFTFWGLIAAGRPGPAAPLGALLALVLAGRELRMSRLRPFSLFTLVFMALAALVAVWLGASLSDKLPGLLAGGFFFLLAACIYGLIQREPFALPYLRGHGEDETPAMRRPAMRVSLLWGAAFLYGFVISLLGMSNPGQAGLDVSLHLALWPLPLVLAISLALLAPFPSLPVLNLAWLRRRERAASTASISEPAQEKSPGRAGSTALPLPEESPEFRGPRDARAGIERQEGHWGRTAQARRGPGLRKWTAGGGAVSRPASLSMPDASFPSGYTVAIVGGGLGGLVCGALLARAGASVVMAERHTQVGGYFNSYRTGGFVFDVGPQMALGIGSGPWAEVNRLLGIDGLMDPRRLGVGVVVGEMAMRIPDSLEDFTAKLIKRFPSEQKGLYRLLADLEAFGSERAEAGNASALPPENPRELRRYIKRRPRACELSGTSFDSYLSTFFKDPGPRSAWGSLSLMLGEEAVSVSASAMAEAILCFFEEGGYCLGGGSGSCTAALAETILSEGGTILEGQGVREIMLSRDGERARGVILEDGSVLKSDAVVSNAGLVQTAKRLIRHGALEAGYLKWVDSFEPSPSSVVLYLAVEGDLDLPDHIYLTPGVSEYVRLPGGDLELSTVLLNACSQADPSRARPGHHAVTMSAPVPAAAFESLVKGSDEESLAAQMTAAAMQRMALTAIPDLYERLVFQELASPLTLHRLTRSFKGATFGVRQKPGQELMARPGVRGPIEGLWLVGADTRYGVGARGATLSGLAAYREIAGGDGDGGRA